MRSAVSEAGQRVAVGFDGHAPSAEVRMLIRDLGAGCVVLRPSNVVEPEQVVELVRELQSLAREAGHDTPLLVAAEYEGGSVTPFRAPWTSWPPARALGRLDAESFTRRACAAMAVELKDCGARAAFAPVLDVETHRGNRWLGHRAFSDDPETVGRLGATWIEELQKASVAAAAKHFPGLGDAEGDGDDVFEIGEPAARLRDRELRPFRRAVVAEVAMIVVGQAWFPEIDREHPAALSRRLVSGMLRDELRYQGVIVADDLCRKGLSDRWTIGARAVLSAQAGCDLLRVDAAGADEQAGAVEALVRAIEGGVFRFRERDDVRRRLRALKERFLAPYRDPDVRRARQTIGCAAHQELALEIADRSGLAA